MIFLIRKYLLFYNQNCFSCTSIRKSNFCELERVHKILDKFNEIVYDLRGTHFSSLVNEKKLF